MVEAEEAADGRVDNTGQQMALAGEASSALGFPTRNQHLNHIPTFQKHC